MTDHALLKQIDDLVASKTFNLDALDGIKKLKDDLQRTLDTLESTSEMLRRERLRSSEMESLGQKQAAQIELLNSLIKANEDKVIKGAEAIFEAAKHKAVAEAWQGAMAMVFKPNTVRETVQRNVARPVEGHPGGNGIYPTPGFLATGQESETITREDA